MTSTDITSWRERLGMNKSEAARRLGMSRMTLDAYEAGRKIPLHVALACAALECRLDENAAFEWI